MQHPVPRPSTRWLAPLLLLVACGPSSESPEASSGSSTSGGGAGCPPLDEAKVPEPTVLVTTGDTVVTLAAAEGVLFWSTGFNGIATAPSSGSPVTTLDPDRFAESIAVDQASLVVATDEEEIALLPKDGTAAFTIATGQTGSGFSGERIVAFDADHVYWAGAGPSGPDKEPGSEGFVRRAGKDGQDLIDLATGLVSPTSLVVDGGFAIWAERKPQGAIVRVPIDGGSVEVIAPDLANPYGLVVRGDELWFSADEGLFRMPKAGGAPALAVHGGGNAVLGAADVYWIAGGFEDPFLVKTPIDGGCDVAIAKGAQLFGAMAIDGERVIVGAYTGTIVAVDP